MTIFTNRRSGVFTLSRPTKCWRRARHIAELIACSTRCCEARLVVQTWLLGRVDNWTGGTLRELGPDLRLADTDSVGNPVRRAEQQSKRFASWRTKASEIEATLRMTSDWRHMVLKLSDPHRSFVGIVLPLRNRSMKKEASVILLRKIRTPHRRRRLTRAEKSLGRSPMSFAPQHDYLAYNAAVAKQLQTQAPLSVEEKFQRYAAYYNTLVQARRPLGGDSEARMEQKRVKIRLHARIVQIYHAVDQLRHAK